MRVLHVMASGDPGGGSNALAALLPALRGVGVESTVVTSPAGVLADTLESTGFAVRRLEMMGRRGDRGLTSALLRAEDSVGPDLIHVHGTRAGFIHFSGGSRRPTVYTAHGLAYRQLGSPLHRAIRLVTELLICRRAAQVIAVSAADLADLRRRHVIPPTKGVHIPNAVDIERFRPGDRTEARKLLGLPADGFVIGTVARLVPGKAIEDLVAAVARLSDVHLVVVGDGPERAALEAGAASLAVDATFTGSRQDVERLLPGFDAFVLPSLWEGEPISLLEAMAAGIPAVSTATTGGLEALARGRGLLVPLRDREALAAAIDRLRTDTGLGARLAQAARGYVAARTWAGAAASYLEVYERVLRVGG